MMISRIDAVAGETITVQWPVTQLGAMLGELRETHVALDIVQSQKTQRTFDNRVGGVAVDMATGEATLSLESAGLRPGEYALMSSVQRPSGALQRKVIRYLTLH